MLTRPSRHPYTLSVELIRTCRDDDSRDLRIHIQSNNEVMIRRERESGLGCFSYSSFCSFCSSSGSSVILCRVCVDDDVDDDDVAVEHQHSFVKYIIRSESL